MTERELSEAAVTAAEEKYGLTYTWVQRREEAETVFNIACRRVVRKMGTKRSTTIEYEIEQVAEQRGKAKARAKAKSEAHRAAHTPEFLKIESKFRQMMRFEHEVLRLAEGVEFDDDMTEIMKDTLDHLRARLELIDMRLAGDAD
jgi:hypothetical protein